jgi:mono/diheme cytochrome c family protein
MKAIHTTFIVIAAIIIAACGSSKKVTTSATPPASAATPNAATEPMVFAKPANGIFAPGNEELAAVQTKHKDATMEQLKEGYVLYTQGACINCHGAKNIYSRGEEQWKDIIDNMAPKARISDVQKDAVYKYVLAIKATQPS